MFEVMIGFTAIMIAFTLMGVAANGMAKFLDL